MKARRKPGFLFERYKSSVARMKRSEIRVWLKMVCYRRNLVPGGTFFLTVTVADRRSSALVDHIAHLRDAFRHARAQKAFTVDAIVVLPDHLRAIMTMPPEDWDFPGRWRAIKASFTRRAAATGAQLSRNARGEYDFWQSRFWEHTIRDEADFERCADYLHFNPVKHGWAPAPHAWPFSSLRRYIRKGILPADWGGDGSAMDGNFGEPV